MTPADFASSIESTEEPIKLISDRERLLSVYEGFMTVVALLLCVDRLAR